MATAAAPLILFMVEGTTAGAYRVKKVSEILPSTVQKLDTDTITPLTAGNLYWFEAIMRALSPPTGNATQFQITYSGTVSYAVAHSMRRTVSRLETNTTYDTSANFMTMETGATITATTGQTHSSSANVNAFGTSLITGLIAPSSDGILAINNGLSANTAGAKIQPYSVFRVEQV